MSHSGRAFAPEEEEIDTDKRIGKTNESGVVKIGPTGGVREAGWCPPS